MSPERLLIVDDEPAVRQVLMLLFARNDYDVAVAISGEDALRQVDEQWPDLVLTDLNMPGIDGLTLVRRLKEKSAKEGKDIECIVVTAYGSTAVAVEAMKVGAIDYVQKPFRNDELLLKVRRALSQRQLERDHKRLQAAVEEGAQYHTLVGRSEPMRAVYDMIGRIKDTRISCLIEGQSGTGKEKVAEAIHYSGIRKKGPFVPINCGAIPENLVESELFGHKKGSFTGASRDKIGLMQAADRGTLFLDEVASLPLAAQVKLLRALQERKITPVGGVQELSVDVRVLAACNVDLEAAVENGDFREDLYYRLNVVKIELPPLRDRGEDILLLARAFLEEFAEEYGKPLRGIAPDARELLMAYHYPGNVRELRNLVERAVALSQGQTLSPEDLPGHLHSDRPPAAQEPPDEDFPAEGFDLDAALAGMEKRWLLAALEESEGRKTQAAKLLKMSFRSFRYRLSKYGLDD